MYVLCYWQNLKLEFSLTKISEPSKRNPFSGFWSIHLRVLYPWDVKCRHLPSTDETWCGNACITTFWDFAILPLYSSHHCYSFTRACQTLFKTWIQLHTVHLKKISDSVSFTSSTVSIKVLFLPRQGFPLLFPFCLAAMKNSQTCIFSK